MRTLLVAVMLLHFSSCSSGGASAQTSVAPTLLLGAGKTYLDEPMMPAVGADVRIGVNDRWAIRPSFLRLANDDWEDHSLMLLVEYALGGRGAAQPYLVAGIGQHASRQTSIDFTAREVSFAGGVGVRIDAGRHFFIAPEVRLGSHQFPAFVVGVGWRLR